MADHGPQPSPRTCLLCTVPRCGSWLLADLLEQTEVVGRPEEYFRPDYRAAWSKELGVPEKSPYRIYIKAALQQTATPNRVFSAKVHWYQLEWMCARLRSLTRSIPGASDAELIAQWLPDPHYVHLQREDTARQAISYYRAAYSDNWFDLVEDDAVAAEPRLIRPIPLPPEPDWGHVRYLEDVVISHSLRWTEYFARSGIEPLRLRYEDLVDSPADTIQHVLDFIGVSLPPGAELPPPRLKKQADAETERLLEQYLPLRTNVQPRQLDLKDSRKATDPRPLHPVAPMS
jgi:trehalose 2-sulfotransferase